MTKKNIIRLTESELKRVISESVRKILKEEGILPIGSDDINDNEDEWVPWDSGDFDDFSYDDYSSKDDGCRYLQM